MIFTGESVRAILDGRKTQTRRLRGLKEINASPDIWTLDGTNFIDGKAVAVFSQPLAGNPNMRWVKPVTCPFGTIGEGLWGKEAWHALNRFNAYPVERRSMVSYEAEEYPAGSAYKPIPEGRMGRLRSSMFMPRWASRLTLEITGVRVKRVQEISEDDARAEGIKKEDLPYDPDAFHLPGSYGFVSGLHPFPHGRIHVAPRDAYAELWNSLNGKKHPWASNPWVWAATFSLEPPIGRIP